MRLAARTRHKHMHLLDLPHCFWDSLPRFLTPKEARGLLSACKDSNAQHNAVQWGPNALVVCSLTEKICEFHVLSGAHLVFHATY